MTDAPGLDSIVELTADIVAAYVANNAVLPGELPQMISDIHAALQKLGSGTAAEEQHAALVPAVPIRKSVTPDYIVSLEDGKKFKSLKRHLSANYNMSPEDYRAKWNLPPDYPMVAPNYAAQRSVLAKTMGLGRKRQEETPPPAPKKTRRKATA